MSAVKFCRIGALPRKDALQLTGALRRLRIERANDASTAEVVIAYHGRRILGWWSFWVRCEKRVVVLQSHYTKVRSAARREGVATALWDYGVTFWKPARIDASVGSRAGHRFLMHQAKRLAARGVVLRVSSHDPYPNIYQEIFNETVAARRRLPSEVRGTRKSMAAPKPAAKVH